MSKMEPKTDESEALHPVSYFKKINKLDFKTKK